MAELPHSDASNWLDAWEHNLHEQATESLRREVEKNPEPRLVFAYAQMLDFQHRWDETIDTCLRCLDGPLKNGPPDALARIYFMLGSAYLKLGRLKDAQDSFAARLRLPANDQAETKKAAITHGIVLEKLGQPELATAHYENVLRSIPDFQEAVYRLKRVKERLTPGNINIVERAINPERFSEIERNINFQPIEPALTPSKALRRFNEIYMEDTATDLSFIIEIDNRPALLAVCHVCGAQISNFSHPILLHYVDGLEKTETNTATRLAVKHLRRLAGHFECSSVMLERGQADHLPLDSSCRNIRGIEGNMECLFVDLSLSEGEIRRHVRKSYRSLVNWGQREMKMVYINKDNPDLSQMDHFRVLFNDLQARTNEKGSPSADMFFIALPEIKKLILEGNGECSIGFLDGTPVAANIIVDDGDTSIYMAGRYAELGNKGASHWPLFNSIMRAKERGMKRFFLGQDNPMQTDDTKGDQIFFFKSGFASDIVDCRLWILTP